MRLHSCGCGCATTVAGHADPGLWPEPKATASATAAALAAGQSLATPWKGAEVRVTLIEKQLAAVYHALLAMELITRKAPTKVITTYPIVGWVRDWTQRPSSGVAQTPTIYHVTGHFAFGIPRE